MKNFLVLFAAAAFCAGCGKKEDPYYLQKTFVMGVPAQVKVYGAGPAAGKEIADRIFAEWSRISGEFSYSDPYSVTSLVNKKAAYEWVKVDDEFLNLLMLSMDYYRLTQGAFDITFAPLWPLWQTAASTKVMPDKGDIQKALQNIGSNYIKVDARRKMVRFTRPIQVNLGGLLRGYCFDRTYRMFKQRPVRYPVEVRLGGNMMVLGRRLWEYRVLDPFKDDKALGKFTFDGGVVMSSSGREHFVQIGGRLYSHILDLKTGYPIENFSNLTVYLPGMEGGNFLSSAVLAVMGQESAFKLLSGIKGALAVWVDGQGASTVYTHPAATVKWEKETGLF
ncbi:MAG: hypothetical protein COT18_09300 [Elusimicrobia bacterium CG08_land_8_20_14_0_20_59_10]|nr:MAG: hypothetical protein COT18_09300 [Elusimicrobia bacterium CG08_land_8_20_14_0_20_59_10]